MWDDVEEETPAQPEPAAEEAPPAEPAPAEPVEAEPPAPENIVMGTPPKKLIFKHWIRSDTFNINKKFLRQEWFINIIE